MARIHPRRRSEVRLLADLETILTPEPRPRAPLLIWRWRYELASLLTIVVAVIMLVRWAGAEWAIISTSAMAGAFGPPWPEWLVARLWCIVTPHRLRSGLTQARIHTRRGRLPVIVRTTPTPRGERVRIWCPAGVSAEDLRSARATLRAACWAADVQIARDERRSQLVIVDVIRRGDEDAL